MYDTPTPPHPPLKWGAKGVGGGKVTDQRDSLLKGEEMVAYEFYWRDPIKGYQLIGTLPERRKSPLRITQESVMNWVRRILGENMDFSDIFFITITIDKNSGDIIRFKD